jgi:hypothetical protein
VTSHSSWLIFDAAHLLKIIASYYSTETVARVNGGLIWIYRGIEMAYINPCYCY